MVNKQDQAVMYFNNGFNCCQAVLTVFAEEIGLNKDDALKIATGFGGGIRKGEVCGAVTGAVMVLGLKYGDNIAGDKKTKEKVYQLTVEFQNRFEEIHGTTICKKLLGYNVSCDKDMIEIYEKGLFNEICPQLIKDAIRILNKL